MEHYRKQVEESALRPDIKEKVLKVLDKQPFLGEDADLVRSLIQQDLDADFGMIDGLEDAVEANPSYQQALKDADQALAAMDGVLASSIQAIEEAEASLSQAEAELSEAERTNGIEEVRSRLAENA